MRILWIRVFEISQAWVLMSRPAAFIRKLFPLETSVELESDMRALLLVAHESPIGCLRYSINGISVTLREIEVGLQELQAERELASDMHSGED